MSPKASAPRKKSARQNNALKAIAPQAACHILFYNHLFTMTAVPNGTMLVSFGDARFQDHVQFARVVKTTPAGKLSIQPVEVIYLSSRAVNHIDTEVTATHGADLPAKKILVKPVGNAFGDFHAPGTDGRAYFGGGMHWHIMQQGLFAKATEGSGKSISDTTVVYVHGSGM
jgi:hypothetical protein